jgi:hypothetical protein
LFFPQEPHRTVPALTTGQAIGPVSLTPSEINPKSTIFDVIFSAVRPLSAAVPVQGSPRTCQRN